MEANTPLWVGLGVLGVILIVSLDTPKKREETPLKKDEKKQETPKKVVL